MKPLHQFLPQLEQNARDHVVDAELATLSEDDLRTLVYQLINVYLRRLESPEEIFENLIDDAMSASEKFQETKAKSVKARACALDKILALLACSLPSIGSPVRTRILRCSGSAKFEDHPLLRGVQLAQQRKIDGKTISGRTWWVVALAGEREDECPDVRWAQLTHTGVVDDERIEISILDSNVLAETIGEKIIGDMIKEFRNRLASVSNGKLSSMTRKDEETLQRLDRAIDALS